MTPQQFIERWQGNELTEKAGAQAHFDDLCDLLGVDKPRKPGEYQFEYGAKKSSGGDGWADVWKRGCFGWENKKPGRDLKAALKQLTDYAPNLESPPLLIVCDRERIEIHTAFNGYPHEITTILLQDIGRLENLQTLRWVFTEPERLRPKKSNTAITNEAAGQFAELAEAMNSRGIDPKRVAHFLIQCLFCMYAEDEGLLPGNVLTHLLKHAGDKPEFAQKKLGNLFNTMKQGGEYGDYDIEHFNGGLFATVDIPPLEKSDVQTLAAAAAEMDWRFIEPAIFGTLFERGLNPAKRSQLGAHFTDIDTILLLIEPVITRPLKAEWETAKAEIAAIMDKRANTKGKGERTKKYQEAENLFKAYLEKLKNFRVLDPACGSGNFLYLALKTLKDLEKQANTDAEILGLQRQIGIEVSPANVLGLEIEPYAAELARVTIWIGEIQWMRKNGYELNRNPILKPLETIENRDSLVDEEGNESEWPKADVIVGNPPFLGDKKMIGELGENYTTRLRGLYKGRVPGGADLVCYWFEKARAQIETGKAKRTGLVATNSIRGGANRKVLDRISETGRIFHAWSDEPWVNEGAAIRVSLVCFSGNFEGLPVMLNGKLAGEIYADLSVGDNGLKTKDITKAERIKQNAHLSFQGSVKVGNFDISGETARKWLKSTNPHMKPNSEVLRPLRNAKDLTSRPRDAWIVDFFKRSEIESALYENPFEHVVKNVKPLRLDNNDNFRRLNWWLHGRTGDDIRSAVKGLTQIIVTPRVSKFRLFVWIHPRIYCDDATVTIARSDNATFGVLHSRFHELWSLGLCTWLGKGNDPRYTPTTTFETFPFPEGVLTDSEPDTRFPEIAEAAKTLNQLRENWLNPPQWVDWVQTEEEIAAGFPKRPVAKPGYEAELIQRTLTKLYNQRPSWLDNAHKTLDKAVAHAYGWTDYTPDWTDEKILSLLLALNLERAKTQTDNPTGSENATIDDALTESSGDLQSSESQKSPTSMSSSQKR